MVDAKVHRKREALIEYCTTHGFGLLLTNGRHSIERLLEKEYNKDFENALIDGLNERGGRTIFFNEFKKIQETHHGQWIEFLAIVLKNNLGLYPFPFKLTKKNNYSKFREVIIKATNNK